MVSRVSIVANRGGRRRRRPEGCTLWRMKRLIAIVEDEPAMRDELRCRLRTQRLRRADIQQPASGACRRFDAAAGSRASSTSRSRTRSRAASSSAASCVRRSAELPIIFLTARDSELDAVSGLRLGADDYLTKDISLAHLIARVAALFRRIEALAKPAGAAQIHADEARSRSIPSACTSPGMAVSYRYR